MNFKTSIYFLSVNCLFTTAYSQDLDRIEQKDFLRIGGNVGTNQVLYAQKGITARRPPYTYVYQGNLNLDFLGITSTLSFMYTNPQFSKNISNPFNTFAYHPKYKGLTLHLGRISSNYSPYTLNGHLYEGGGFDYAPKKIPITVSATFGRFQKAISPDSAFLADTLTSRVITIGLGPSYLRWGGGFKVQWNPKAFKLGIIGFRAKDDATSLSNVPLSSRLKPQENTVVSVNFSKPIYKQLAINGELALSALNSNNLAENSSSTANSKAFNLLGMDAKLGSGLYKTYKIGMAYTGSLFNLGVSYERIDPNYRTLGTYFFNNDLENTTVNFSTSLFKKRLNVGTNFGIQRDDLDRKKATNMRRLVGSINLNLVASQRLNFNASYSNFRSFSNTRSLSQTLTASPTTYIDTLQYRQISQNANLGYTYLLSNKEKTKQNLNGNLTHQRSADIQGEGHGSQASYFYNLTMGYGIQFVSQNLGINISGNGSRNDFDKNSNTLFGPSLALTKAFFKKKLRSNASVTYIVSQGSGNSKIMTTRVGLAYTFRKSHNFTLNGIYLNSDVKNTKRVTFKEYTLTMGYSYTFKVFDRTTMGNKSKNQNTDTKTPDTK